MMERLSIDNGRTLVALARQAITDHLESKKTSSLKNMAPLLSQQRGVFVTLTDNARGGELRGCIGNPFPKTSLIQETIHCAVEAATMDPRFEPIEPNEFAQSILVEVTALTPPENILVKSPLDLPLNIEVGRDGLLVSGGGSRGLLLPQVAVDEDFNEEEFLSQCCMKAGLTPDAWLTGSVRVARFQGQIFSEQKPQGTVVERKLSRDKT